MSKMITMVGNYIVGITGTSQVLFSEKNYLQIHLRGNVSIFVI